MTSTSDSVLPQWRVDNKSTHNPYQTFELPDTTSLASCTEKREETSGGWKKRYVLRAYDEKSRNQYTWEGFEEDFKRFLTQEDTSEKSKNLMTSAAEDLNLFGDKQISKKESFVTSNNKNVTWWRESKEGCDEKTRYRFEVVDLKGRKRTESLSMARLEDKAKYSIVASTILAKVKGVEASMAPEGKSSKSEQHGGEWKLVLDDITRKSGGTTSVDRGDTTGPALSSSTASGA
ncbi:uncharacterized protein L199_006917 [Kwoniella botswanensis]|uniref:uncharacterized protein n=1 Tax=Kwoniella botswanensis TaxID=1268659 RepID=UPI00315D9799